MRLRFWRRRELPMSAALRSIFDALDALDFAESRVDGGYYERALSLHWLNRVRTQLLRRRVDYFARPRQP